MSMLSEIIIIGQSLEPRPFDWFAFGGLAALAFCSLLFVLAVPWVQDAVERTAKSFGLLVRRDFVASALVTVFFVGMVANNTAKSGEKPEPPPPVIVVKDIEIKSYRCDHTGCSMSWSCGTNIAVGVDRFVIQRSTRQIPAREGWSAYADYCETTATNWATATPQHASDVRWKVLVRKEGQ